MSEGSLSQEEIDALVNGGAIEPAADADPVADAAEGVVEEIAAEETAAEEIVAEEAGSVPEADPAAEAEAAPAATAPAAGGENLTDVERDTVGEVGNICMSSAATALSALLQRPVQITTPVVEMVSEDEVRGEFAGPAVLVMIEYTEGLSGRNIFILSTRDASVVADLMMGGEGAESEEIGELHASAVGEAMNQMMGSAATAMAEMVGHRVDISAPHVEMLDLREEAFGGSLGFDGPLVRTSFQLKVGELLDTRLMQLMPIEFARGLVSALTPETSAPAAPAAPSAPATPAPEAPVAAPAAVEDDRHLHSVPVPVAQPVTFPSLDDMPATPGGSDISLLLDVPLQVTVELGRTQLRIRDVLELVPGSIVELDKLAGGPVDVLVNGKQIAKGEVVVIDEEFGVRITDVASQAKRLRGLAAEGA
jgi:flagellar motor switch protein FliN/FliY